MSSGHSEAQNRWVQGGKTPAPAQLSEFEKLCQKLDIDEDDIDVLAASPAMIEFVEAHRLTNYVPVLLLERLNCVVFAYEVAA